MLQSYTLPAREPRRAAGVILHGLGDSHQGMAGIAAALALPDIDYVLPDAPDSYFGMGYSWYTIPQAFFEQGAAHDRGALMDSCRDEVTRSRALVHDLLDRVAAMADGLPMILGGFSQGGLMALDAGLTWPRPLAGLFCLSGYFPHVDEALADRQPPWPPVFIGHGDADEVVAFAYSGETRDALRAHGLDVEYHAYTGLGHSVDQRELDDLRRFIVEVVGRSG